MDREQRELNGKRHPSTAMRGYLESGQQLSLAGFLLLDGVVVDSLEKELGTAL